LKEQKLTFMKTLTKGALHSITQIQRVVADAAKVSLHNQKVFPEI